METNLYRCRIAKNYTQRELANRSGVPLYTICMYERKKRLIENATLPILMALAETLSVPIYRLLDDRKAAISLQRIERERGFLT